MKIYLKGYDYNDTLSTDFPMNACQIQDTLDRMAAARRSGLRSLSSRI